MHFGDSIFIFLLALVLFGPKKLPEIGRQIGKLLAEFRRASNDFKMQIDEELRTMEQQERQKQLELAAAAPANQLPAETAATQPSIMPPSTGEPVSSTARPYTELPVAELPVAEIAAEYQEALAKEEQTAREAVNQPAGLNGASPEPAPEISPESEQAPIHHG
jgi:sec-independent protein translocase protein TatB